MSLKTPIDMSIKASQTSRQITEIIRAVVEMGKIDSNGQFMLMPKETVNSAIDFHLESRLVYKYH